MSKKTAFDVEVHIDAVRVSLQRDKPSHFTCPCYTNI